MKGSLTLKDLCLIGNTNKARLVVENDELKIYIEENLAFSIKKDNTLLISSYEITKAAAFTNDVVFHNNAIIHGSIINESFNLKASLDSPEFTGIPTANTADESDSSNQLATTQFVTNKIKSKADVLDPVFSNNLLVLNTTNLNNVKITGQAIISGSGSLMIGSDDRLKHNELPIVNALQAILKLKPQKYDKGIEGQENQWRKEAGFIAQEVLSIEEFQTSVAMNQDGFYSVNYTDILTYAVSAIQELTMQVHTLNQQVYQQQQDIQKLKLALGLD